MSAFFCKKSTFFGKNSVYTQSNSKNIMTSQFADMASLSKFFGVVLFLLSSLVTGPSFIAKSSQVLEFFYKGLTRNPEIGNTIV